MIGFLYLNMNQGPMIIKCVFLVYSLNAGGIENYLLRFLNFYKDVIEATVVCKSAKTGQLEDKYVEVGFDIMPIKLLYFDVFNYLKLYRILKRGDYDAVVDFTGNFATLPLFVAKLAGIPKRIAFYRGSTRHFKEDILRLTYDKILNKFLPFIATDILSNSKAGLDYFHPGWQGKQKFDVVYNGIDTVNFMKDSKCIRTELGIPKEAFVVGHIGRYNEAKNHETIFRVAYKLLTEHPTLYFLLVGEGVDNYLIDDWDNGSLKSRMIMPGYRSDVNNILHSIDCFIFPSITEGQPNALIEAMVAGLPVVASDIQPIRETVPNEFEDLLLHPYDTKGFCRIIETLISDPITRNKYKLQEWACNNFDHRKKFGEFYNKLV